MQSKYSSEQRLYMRGVHKAGYGGIQQLSIRELSRPIPKHFCVLVKVKAVSINAEDRHMLAGRPYLTRCVTQRIPGMDFSGIISAIDEESVTSGTFFNML
jgi:NADPH:quinone reductase-like Zn-dependent oxidoreductase